MGACASAPRELKDEINAAPEPAKEEMFDAVEGQEDVKADQQPEEKKEDDDNKTQSLGSLLDEVYIYTHTHSYLLYILYQY